jgi:toxin ParE1/3/4
LRVRFTPSGEAQFLEAIAFLIEENRPAALRFRKRVEKALRRLARFPRSGRIIPEFPELPHRELLYYPYRVFYRIERRTIWVVSVWHGARLLEGPGSPGV